MKSTALLSLLNGLLFVHVSLANHGPLNKRALPDSPSGGYAPDVVDCPTTRPEIRLAGNLSDEESKWLSLRRNITLAPMRQFLEKANISGFDVGQFFRNAGDNFTAIPNIAIAASGGGYRALMNGAGFISASDSRNDDNSSISGLLQSTTYLAGLSGGGWLVGSIFANNFSTIPALQEGKNGTGLWAFDRSIFKGPDEGGIKAFDTVSYWNDLIDAVDSKSKGWDTSITDYWGRALSYQLIGTPDGGVAYTFSSIANTSNFQNGSTPFPILVADGRKTGELVAAPNATIYEFNPYELGSWDNTVYGFAPIRYIASNFTNGTISSKGECVRGYDQFGFVMGTSSSLFNEVMLANFTGKGDEGALPSFVTKTIEDLLKNFNEQENDVAQYAPNPFFGWNPTTNNSNAKENDLSLVDGGEDGQNIPLHPLIQPVRDVDIIFAIDSSADTNNNWPNGTAMRASYNRSMADIANNTLFPPVPSAETFINLGLNRRPTLFGCNATNFTLTDNQTVPPLIFYIPNAPYTTQSNVSTFDLAYSNEQRDNIILNGFNGATQGNGTIDAAWPTCVACAILSRSWYKAGQDAPQGCNQCFERYCWNGTTDETLVKDYEPSLIIQQGSSESSGQVLVPVAYNMLFLALVISSFISLV